MIFTWEVLGRISLLSKWILDSVTFEESLKVFRNNMDLPLSGIALESQSNKDEILA